MSHAEFSPSAAHRWIKCPRSVVLSQNRPSTSSFYSAEGTVAHQLGDTCLTTGADPEVKLGTRVSVDGHEITITDEMVEAVRLYAEIVNQYPMGPRAQRHVEVRVHLNGDVWGTADCIIWDADAEFLLVVDLKYGKGVSVDADDNEQLMIYGLAAARTLGVRPKTISVCIVQPRVSAPVKSASFTFLDLLLWEDQCVTPALIAAKDPFTPLVTGSHCRFCPARPDCPALREEVLKTAQLEFGFDAAPPEPTTLTSEALGEILDKAELISAWVAAVRAEASARIDRGEQVKGWKLVAKRAMRKWGVPEREAEEILSQQAGLNHADLYDYSIRSVAKIEKLVDGILGKGAFVQKFQPALVVKESSGTTLVPVDDSRVEVKTGPQSDFEEV